MEPDSDQARFARRLWEGSRARPASGAAVPLARSVSQQELERALAAAAERNPILASLLPARVTSTPADVGSEGDAAEALGGWLDESDAERLAVRIVDGADRSWLFVAVPPLALDRAALLRLAAELAGPPEAPTDDLAGGEPAFALAIDSDPGDEDSADPRITEQWPLATAADAWDLPLAGERGVEARSENASGWRSELVALPPDTARRLEATAERFDVPLAAVLLALWQRYLMRAADADEISVEVCFEGPREAPLGLHESWVPIPASRSAAETLEDAAVQVHTLTHRLARAGQFFRAEPYANELAAARAAGLGPVAFRFASAPASATGVALSRILPARVELACAKAGSTIRIQLGYDAGRLDAISARRIAHAFAELAESAAGAPGASLEDLALAGADETAELLAASRAASASRDECRTLGERLARIALTAPHRIAIEASDGAISYGALHAAAAAWGEALRTRFGLRAEDRVVLRLERGASAALAFLAVLEAGCAAVPLALDLPDARLRALIRDADPKLVLTDAPLPPGLAVPAAATCDLPLPAGTPRPGGSVLPDQLAYLIFTSGSTGEPKAVAVTHAGLPDLAAAQREVFGVAAGDRVAQHFSASFDGWIADLTLAIGPGATLCVDDRPSRSSGRDLAHWLRSRAATVAVLPPAVLCLLDPLAVPALRIVASAGEACTPALARAWSRDRAFFNAYGPSEATVWSTWHRCTGTEGGSTPIGRPIPGASAYVVDRSLRLAPSGMAGELAIGGTGVARGYFGRPRSTAERFVPDPHSAVPGARLYRTGDVVRRSDDRGLEFLGRDDLQAKVRGYRIELGEIEAALSTHPRVRRAHVAVETARHGDRRLAAYVEAAPVEGDPDARVDAWRGAFDSRLAARGPDDDYAGWISTYTGEPLGRAAMDEWLDRTVAHVAGFRAESVLEIGCGTGLVARRLAGSCASYLGVDVSGVSLAAASTALAGHGPRVRLLERAADDLAALGDETFDAIVLNSVVQYFPGAAYLRRVMAGALRRLRPGGHLFVGDVRNLALHETFLASVIRYGARADAPLDRLWREVQAARIEEPELLVHPRWFAALAADEPRIASAAVLVRGGRHENELSRYRYDVVLRAADDRARHAAKEPDRIAWDEALAEPDALGARLAGTRSGRLRITGIPNARIAQDVAFAERLRDGLAPATLAEWDEAASGAGGGWHPQALVDRAAALGFAAVLEDPAGDASARFDATLVRRGAGDAPPSLSPVTAARALEPFAGALTNRPSAREDHRELERELLERLSERLPHYMVPAAIVALDALPTTRHQKLDRRALPLPRFGPTATPGALPAASHEEELVAGIWQDVLEIERVGRDDDFFALGGHSLLATTVAARISAAFGVDLPVAAVFEAPTVRGLARCVRREADQARCLPELEHEPEDRAAPLTAAQRRIWFLEQLEEATALYNMPVALKLTGELSRNAVEGAIADLVARHRLLRMGFREVDGTPHQVPVTDVSVALDFRDLRPELEALPAETQRARVAGYVADEVRRPFRLDRPPLFRAGLWRLAAGEHLLIANMHHLIADGWSIGVLVREFAELYSARIAGRVADLPPLAVQYDDYARWQRDPRFAERSEEHLAHWESRLAGAPALLDLPTDRPRPARQSIRGALHRFRIPGRLLGELAALGRERGSTLFTTMLAAFSVVLSRYANQRDVCVGTQVANRPAPALEGLIGLFLNTVVVRTDVDPEVPFAELLAAVREGAIDALRHQDVPFEAVVDRLQPVRSLSFPPLFQVLFLFQNLPIGALQLPGVRVEPLDLDVGVAKFDLTLILEELEDGLRGTVEYCADLFDRETIEGLVESFVCVLRAIARDPEQRVGALPLQADEDRSRLPAGPTLAPCPETVLDRIGRVAAERPHAAALACGDDQLSYGALLVRAERVAAALHRLGVRPGDRVAVCAERSVELVIAILGILAAGAAYLPLDPSHPADRNRFALRDAEVALVVTHGSAAAVRQLDVRVVDVADLAGSARLSCASSDGAAYLIYTSGSTGRPKGVVVGHRNLTNFCRAMDLRFARSREPRRWLAVTSVSFDISILELLFTLAQGDAVAIDRPARAAAPAASRAAAPALSLFFFAAASDEATPYALLLESAAFADAAGFEAVWLPERHFHAFGGDFPNPAVAAAAVAGRTRRVAIRAGSVVLPLHHPVRIAEEWAMVDRLLAGRVGLSFASGWHENDFVLAPDAYTGRRDRLAEGIEAVRALWRGESRPFPNGRGAPTDVATLPRPVQRELPFWITAAGTPASFERRPALGANVRPTSSASPCRTSREARDLRRSLAAARPLRRARPRDGHGAHLSRRRRRPRASARRGALPGVSAPVHRSHAPLRGAARHRSRAPSGGADRRVVRTLRRRHGAPRVAR